MPPEWNRQDTSHSDRAPATGRTGDVHAWRGVVALLRAAGYEYERDYARYFASAMVYFALYSLVPLLMLLLAVLGLLLRFSDAAAVAERQVLATVGASLGAEALTTIQQLLDRLEQQSVATGLLSLVGLVLTSSVLFRNLRLCFRAIWKCEPPLAAGSFRAVVRATLAEYVVANLIVLVGGLLLLLALGLMAVTQWLGAAGWLLAVPVPLILVTLTFALLFKTLPPVRLPWRHVWLAAVICAVAWTVASEVVVLYGMFFGSRQGAPGAIGGILVGMLWLNLVSKLLFFGGELCKVVALRDGPRRPDDAGSPSTDRRSSIASGMDGTFMTTPDTETARRIAREAYVYGFPLVESYKTLYKQAIDAAGQEFKAPLNQIGHAQGVATPDDTQFVTPNTDTPYSYLWADLQAEPIVITMPAVEPGRYYTGQLIDLYTHNFAYLGTRTFGNGGGDFLIAGPGWHGEAPVGIQAVIRCETNLFYVLFRVQLFGAFDLDTVRAIQAGITAQPLSQFLGSPAAPAAPAVVWPTLTEGMTETAAIFSYLNFLLQFAPTHPSEIDLMARFARLGIGAGQSFDAATLSPSIQQAIADGITDVWQQDFAGVMTRVNAGEVTSAHVFGTREYLQSNYLYRFLAAKLGIYGNSGEEAIYPPYFVDADGSKLDASQHRYLLRFENGQLPPAKAFWSVTMYDGPSQLLVANRLQRYVLNSTMLEDFTRGPDGSLILHFQKDTPGAGLESNWLPAPDGPFYLMMRIYLPEPAVLDGTWKPPPLQRAP